MEFAIAGLSTGGKTTLFEALTGATGASAGKGAQKGALVVPDERVDALTKLSKSKKTTYATMQLWDSQGLSADESGAQYNDRILGELRDADGLLILVRVFQSSVIPHPMGEVNPIRDVEKVVADLRLADLGIIEKRLPKLEQVIPRTPKPEREKYEAEREILLAVRRAVEDEADVDLESFSETDLLTVKGYGFFTRKPVMVIANVGDLTTGLEKGLIQALSEWGEPKGIPVVAINAGLEKELQEFPEEERGAYYEEMGLPGPGLSGLLKTAYAKMDLISFLTTGEKESRAWPVPRDVTAQRAAGAIHTDLMKGFIRADVISYDDLIRLGSEAEAKKAGLMRAEGKEYIVQDGDVMLFHFSK